MKTKLGIKIHLRALWDVLKLLPHLKTLSEKNWIATL